MNDEENRAEDAEALVAAGVRVHSMSPRSLAVVGPAVVALGQAVGAGVPALFIVKYPVTVRMENETYCLSVTSYCPLPVEAAANYCAGQK